MKEKSELAVAQISKDFFLGEFEFDELQYVPSNLQKGDTKELADVVINYGNNLIGIQIKERKNQSASSDEDKWMEKHIARAKDQLVDTFQQLTNNEIPVFVNGKGDTCKIKDSGIFTGIIILYNEKLTNYKKVLSCSRLNGIVHCFSYDDFSVCCRKIILPRDIMEYISYRERHLEIDKKSNYEEKALIDEFLMYKYGTAVFNEAEVDTFKWFLNHYKERLVDGEKDQYRQILEVFLELDRAGVNAFAQRLSKIISCAKDRINTDNSFIKPANQEMSSYLFISSDSGKNILEYVERMTFLFMYKTKSEKCITVIAYFDTEEEFRLDWVYVEQQWEYDKEMEKFISLPEIKSMWNPKMILTGKVNNID